MTIDQQVRAWFAAGSAGPPLAIHPDDVPRAREVLSACIAELTASHGVLAPHQLPLAHGAGQLTAEQLQAAWVACEWPCRALPASQWIALFRALVRPPRLEPIEVWRAQVGPDLGIAWTTDRDAALWFHRRNIEGLRLPGVLLHRVAQPEHVLAVIDGPEREILIEP